MHVTVIVFISIYNSCQLIMTTEAFSSEPVSKRALNVSLNFNENTDGDLAIHKRSKMEDQTQMICDYELFAKLTSLDHSKSDDLCIPYKHHIRIGRSGSKNNDIILKQNDCSSVHCELQVGKSVGDFYLISIKDLSSNGTFINDVLIGRNNSSLLRDGDRISFAANLHFIVRYNPKFKSNRPSFNDYYVLKDTVLGTGHYAQVKETYNRSTCEVCAVKIFHPTSRGEQANQLNRELEILTSLNHPNIVGFYGNYLEPVSMTSLTTYLVLEKINGGELFNRIVRKGKLGQDETREITIQLLKGLNYLHSLDIVHRDLKPENILLNVVPTDGNQPHNKPWDIGELSVQVKIADFGLAKFIGEFQFTSTLCGTPAYVAPEILVNSQQRKYNKSVDMWSVGVLLYVCLCGFPPFSEELGPPSMRQQILEAKFAFYSPYWDEIEDIVLDLISRLLAANPSDRITVTQALQHPWLQPDNLPSNDNYVSQQPTFYEDIAAITRQMSTRSQLSKHEPISLKVRAATGLTDEMIAERYGSYERKTDFDGDYEM